MLRAGEKLLLNTLRVIPISLHRFFPGLRRGKCCASLNGLARFRESAPPRRVGIHGGQVGRPGHLGAHGASPQFQNDRSLVAASFSFQGFGGSLSLAPPLLLPSSGGAEVAGSAGVVGAVAEDDGESLVGSSDWVERSEGGDRDAFLS